MDTQVTLFPQIVTERRVVRNVFPFAEPTSYRLAIIGEAPGENEEQHGVPFVGASGSHLNRELSHVGLDRNQCFIGNVCQVRPPGNKIEAFDWSGTEIQSGLAQLKNDIAQFAPHLCLLLGSSSLRAARPSSSITGWRGSLFGCDLLDSPFYGRKCLATYHPAYVLREFEANPLFRFDLQRAAEESVSSDLILPKRELLTGLSCAELCWRMDNWPAGVRCSVDIEGGLPEWAVNDNVKKDSKKRRHIGWRCVALSDSPLRAFAIAWWKFSDTEKCSLLQSFARLMFRMDVPKVLQNSLYDSFVLGFGYKILVRNVAEDTMVKGWEVYCELPKGLSTQASIWTREPHWKDDDMYESTGENLALGCCKDTAVTLEICEAQDSALSGSSLIHYRANMAMLNPALYMELRGMKYDQENVTRLLNETFHGWLEPDTDGQPIWKKGIYTVGEDLNRIAGTELRGKKGSLSAQRLAKYLYEVAGYPIQYKKEAGRKTEKYTTDIEALLNLRKQRPNDQFLDLIIRHRHLEGRIETLSIVPDADGRVRCAYNVVGTETGRFSCKTSPTGAGANLTTVTKSLRSNYVADTDYDFFQCDLAGADGWTVAGHCLRLGDSTMFEDYQFGLKPAKILVLMAVFGSAVNQMDRDDIAFWCSGDRWKAVTSLLGGPDVYECTKSVSHGTNYLMGIPTTQKTIMVKSFQKTGKPVYMDHAEVSRYQANYHLRYRGLRYWHQWAESQLIATGALTSASGHTRNFFGRRWGKEIHETVKQFLADEPQQNTTWATNLAMLRLWQDPENRRPDGSLIIEPLHQVHDALCGQWPSACRDWARAKVRTYFDNPLDIAGLKITIPFEGAWGRSWGECKNPL